MPLGLELATDARVVVEFAIAGHGDGIVLVVKRLLTTGQINNAQSDMAQADPALVEDRVSGAVGTTVIVVNGAGDASNGGGSYNNGGRMNFGYALQVLERIRAGEFREASPTFEAMRRFDAERREAAKHTIWASGCRSWSSPTQMSKRSPRT